MNRAELNEHLDNIEKRLLSDWHTPTFEEWVRANTDALLREYKREWPDCRRCGRQFRRVLRQIYCNPKCAQLDRWHRWDDRRREIEAMK